MKKHLLIIVLSLHFINAKAQAWIYHPMPESNAVWRIDWHSGTWCVPAGGLYSSYQNTIGGDTTIGSYTYKKIYRSGMEGLCISPYYSYSCAGGIRNDSVKRKFMPLGI